MTKLKEVRLEKEMTLGVLSVKANLSISNLCLWEKGKLPTIQTARKLAKALETPVEELFPVDDLKNIPRTY